MFKLAPHKIELSNLICNSQKKDMGPPLMWLGNKTTI